MYKNLLFFTVALALVGAMSPAYAATPRSYDYNGHTYYVVDGNDPNLNSGSRVCAAVGKTCVGYTALTTDVCKYFHPDASVTQSVNGSKSGFYCNGAPQTGLACGTATNNCQICPQCNVNADCEFQIGGLFREMYVECASSSTVPIAQNWWSTILANFQHWWQNAKSYGQNMLNSVRQRAVSLFQLTKIQSVTVQVVGPKGIVAQASIPPDSVACEFYQTNKKLVSCGAYKAADTYCALVMQSRFARAALCQENGVIVCTNPCHPPEYQVPITHCAFDNARPRGNQAPPLNFCNQTQTLTVQNGAAPSSGGTTQAQPGGTKLPGQVCQNGGECTTGNCLRDNGVYRCSCSNINIDYYSCKK